MLFGRACLQECCKPPLQTTLQTHSDQGWGSSVRTGTRAVLWTLHCVPRPPRRGDEHQRILRFHTQATQHSLVFHINRRHKGGKGKVPGICPRVPASLFSKETNNRAVHVPRKADMRADMLKSNTMSRVLSSN